MARPNRLLRATAEVPTHECFFCGALPTRRQLSDLEGASEPIGLCFSCVEDLIASHAFVCLFCTQVGRKTKADHLRESGYGGKICDRCVEEFFLDLHARKEVYEMDAEILGIQPPVIRKKFEVRAGHVFYLGPFRERFTRIYRTQIAPAVMAHGFSITRADEIYGTRPVIEDIWRGISEAGIIIADVTGGNPNVMYEVGVAHCIGKPVVLLAQDIKDVPFDFRHYRCIIYNESLRGFQKLAMSLRRTLREWRASRRQYQLPGTDRRLPNKRMEPTRSRIRKRAAHS